jgi:hypothetical protein
VQSIVNAGVTIVTLMDSKEYSVKVLRADPMSLVYMILMFTRGHEESATKSKRIADAWRRKRNDLVNGKRLTSITPGWIELDAKGKPRLVPERVKVLRRIFTLFIAGDGRSTIAAKLNRDGVPTFRGGKYWIATYVRQCLVNRAVLGEFQPCKVDHSNPRGRKIRVPDGEPIMNYWPPAIDVKTFAKAQQRLEDTRGQRIAQPRSLKNIFSGIGRCPECDGPMERLVKHPGPRLLLVCARSRYGGGCKYRIVSMADLEAALTGGAETLATDVPDASADLSREIAALEAQQTEIQARIDDMVNLLTNTPSKTVALRIQHDEAELGRIKAELDRLTQQLHYGSTRRIRDTVSRMKAALQWHAKDQSDAIEVNAALRECFEKIVVDYPRRQLVMHWRHGQTTALPY